jgi:hypothetical protein
MFLTQAGNRGTKSWMPTRWLAGPLVLMVPWLCGCLDFDKKKATDAGADASLPRTTDAGGTGPLPGMCDPGFEPDGAGGCTDVDECARGTDDCDTEPRACKNRVAVSGVRFECVCPNGYEGDGIGADGCVDIDECERGTDDCDADPEACVNSEGGFACQCPKGYVGDGKGEGGCCQPATCQAEACGSVSDGWGGTLDCGGCEGGSQCSGAAMCEDIDECADINVCTDDYPCRNETPYYSCRGQFPDWRNVNALGPYTTTADTVLDQNTGLMWQRKSYATAHSCAGDAACDALAAACDIDGRCTAAEAAAYCAGLTLGGHTDWRIPSLRELLSIVDLSRASPAVNVASFPSTNSNAYWTGSVAVAPTPLAWWVNFSDGAWDSAAPTEAYFVRCVR